MAEGTLGCSHDDVSPLVLWWPRVFEGWVWTGRKDTGFDRPGGNGWGNGFGSFFINGNGESTRECSR